MTPLPASAPRRRTALALGGVSLASLLAACSAEQGGDAGGGTDVLERIQDSGTIRIGIEGTYRPYAFHDDSGALVGFEKEIADAIAAGLGVAPEYIETEWDSLIAGLDVDRYDLVINNVGITPEREEKYAFSQPYARSIGRIAVPAGSDITTPEDVEGARAAQTATSNWAQQMEELGAEIVPVQGFAEAMELLLQGRADATANDIVSFQTYQEEHPEASFRLLDEELPDETTVGVIMQQGQDPLLAEVNAILEEMKGDGSLTAIYEEWVGQDITPEG